MPKNSDFVFAEMENLLRKLQQPLKTFVRKPGAICIGRVLAFAKLRMKASFVLTWALNVLEVVAFMDSASRVAELGDTMPVFVKRQAFL